jgi:hypothetical protein
METSGTTPGSPIFENDAPKEKPMFIAVGTVGSYRLSPYSCKLPLLRRSQCKFHTRDDTALGEFVLHDTTKKTVP